MSRRVDDKQQGPEGGGQHSRFEDFPYLVTRVAVTLNHIMILPGELGRKALEEIARHQALRNQLNSCVVFGEGDCVYYGNRGSAKASPIIPESALYCAGLLYPGQDFVASEDLRRRCRGLDSFIAAVTKTCILFGDLTKGGRPATADEMSHLAGFQERGVPLGIERCRRCGEWRGECLDPSPQFSGMIMRVSCLCENDNRCARCGETLDKYKLNSNYYDHADGMIWHVPAFSGLTHRCPDLA